MIKFIKIRWKNFLSTGNIFTEVNLDNTRTTILVGSNGSGKSTLLDALTFSLFGKSFRGINKPQLVNSINDGDMIVEIEFIANGSFWKIVRGLKPTVFEIFQNDKLLDRHSSVIDQQNWLEENVLRMNYKSFTQIVILGSSNFVPFMQLPPAHRREVVEDLLDIKIFSVMNAVLKEKIKEEKELLSEYKGKLVICNEKIKIQEKYLDDIDKQLSQIIIDNKTRIDELIGQINELENLNGKINDEIIDINEKLKDLSNCESKLKKMNIIKGKLREKRETYKKELKFFNGNLVCPTCTQNIDENFRVNKVEKIQSKLQEIENGYDELDKSLRLEEKREQQLISFSKKLTTLSNAISQNNIRIFEFQKQISDIEYQIQKTSQTHSSRDTESITLESYKEEKNSIQDRIINLQDILSYYNYTLELLKDSGIKSQLIKSYLPIINQHILRYLQLMSFSINFSLNEEFEEEIISPIHDNYSYTSFSEGERAKINLAILFSLREMAKAKNSINSNLIIFDEIFDSSLDSNGIDDFLAIIKFIVKDLNVFIISHKDNLIDKFNNIIKVEKKGNFSTFEYV